MLYSIMLLSRCDFLPNQAFGLCQASFYPDGIYMIRCTQVQHVQRKPKITRIDFLYFEVYNLQSPFWGYFPCTYSDKPRHVHGFSNKKIQHTFLCYFNQRRLRLQLLHSIKIYLFFLFIYKIYKRHNLKFKGRNNYYLKSIYYWC